MKFLAIVAIIATVSAMEGEMCAEGECKVTDPETMESACTAIVEGETMCDEEEDWTMEEEEGSNALFASAAAFAVAATIMY